MSDIKKIKNEEMDDIQNFCNVIEEYGHIFHMNTELLDEPFNKIMEGISEVHKMMDESWEM